MITKICLHLIYHTELQNILIAPRNIRCFCCHFEQERIAKEKREKEEAKKIPHLSNLNEDAGLTGKLQHLCMPGQDSSFTAYVNFVCFFIAEKFSIGLSTMTSLLA